MKGVIMKAFHILLSFLMLICLMAGSLLAQEPAVIGIDLNRTVGDVDPKIYGGFVEPIGNIVYGTMYEPDSPLADENGFRSDFIELMKELKITVVRWPGGNFVSGYDWRDGIGPKDQRPARLELAWGQVETNQMGTDEYVKLFNLMGAENFICINAGLGTLDQARYWIEYCNFPQGTHYSDLRREYGNEEPFAVEYWGLGNEIDGPWQVGQKNAEDYCKFALEAAKIMTLVDEDIKLIASGASDYNPDNGWIDWNEYVLQQMVGEIDYLSVHRYVNERLGEDQSFAGMMSLGLDVDEKIDIIKNQIDTAVMQSGTDRPVYISFDEYGVRGNNLTGSLILAQHLNSFVRHADIVKMANLTMLSSLVGYAPDGHYRNTMFHAFSLFSQNAHGISLDVHTDCGTYTTDVFDDIPYLDVTAVLNETDDMLVVNVINRHETDAQTASIELQNGEFTGTATVNVLNGDTPTATITRDRQDVAIATSEIRARGTELSYRFPAHSLTQMLIPIR